MAYIYIDTYFIYYIIYDNIYIISYYIIYYFTPPPRWSKMCQELPHSQKAWTISRLDGLGINRHEWGAANSALFIVEKFDAQLIYQCIGGYLYIYTISRKIGFDEDAFHAFLRHPTWVPFSQLLTMPSRFAMCRWPPTKQAYSRHLKTYEHDQNTSK